MRKHLTKTLIFLIPLIMGSFFGVKSILENNNVDPQTSQSESINKKMRAITTQDESSRTSDISPLKDITNEKYVYYNFGNRPFRLKFSVAQPIVGVKIDFHAFVDSYYYSYYYAVGTGITVSFVDPNTGIEYQAENSQCPLQGNNTVPALNNDGTNRNKPVTWCFDYVNQNGDVIQCYSTIFYVTVTRAIEDYRINHAAWGVVIDDIWLYQEETIDIDVERFATLLDNYRTCDQFMYAYNALANEYQRLINKYGNSFYNALNEKEIYDWNYLDYQTNQNSYDGLNEIESRQETVSIAKKWTKIVSLWNSQNNSNASKDNLISQKPVTISIIVGIGLFDVFAIVFYIIFQNRKNRIHK